MTHPGQPRVRRWMFCLVSTIALMFVTAACGASESLQRTECPGPGLDATVIASTPGSTDLHLSGSAGCHGGTLEVLLIEVPTADAALGPSIRDGSHAVVWSTGKATFDRTVTIDHLVTLVNGQSADAGAGHWMIGLRQDGTVDAQPVPDGF